MSDDRTTPSDVSGDALLGAVAAGLVGADVDAVTAQRIRARAHAELAAPRRLSLAALLRVVEPALVAGFAASYLAWAVQSVLTVYR